MSETLTKETINVEVVGKFGVKSGESWYGVNEPVKLTDFEKGQSYVVDVSTSKTGKKYIKAVEKNGAAPIAEKKEAAVAPAKPAYKKPFFAKKAESGMTDEKWAAKDRSQMIGGLSHDAVQLVLAHVQSAKSMPDLLKLYKEALDGMVKMRDEVK